MIWEFIQLVRSLSGGEEFDSLAIYAVGIFGHQTPEKWQAIGHQIVHVHGKFFEFDADGNDVSVDNEVLLRMLVEAEYDGYISSEWEGWHWNSEPDPFDMVAAHHKLSKRILSQL